VIEFDLSQFGIYDILIMPFRESRFASKTLDNAVIIFSINKN